MTDHRTHHAAGHRRTTTDDRASRRQTTSDDRTGRERTARRDRTRPRSTAHLAAVALLIAALAAGCADGGDAPAPDAVPPAAELPPTEDVALSVTPEDSAIFVETMRWARHERLDTLRIGPLIAALGRRFVGAPYEPGTLDPPGPERLVVNLRTFDCVTYVESMIAMARTLRAGEPTFGAFVGELRRIRYRDGVPPEYPARLHYFSDWIAANDAKGIVESVTASLGGLADPEPIDFMTTHREAYPQLADSSALRAIRDVELRLNDEGRVYIPEDAIAAVADQIRDGDIIAATSTVKGLDIAHTGVALWVDGALHLMHAPLVGKVVEISEQPLAQRIQRIEGQDGIMVARPR